MSPPVLVVSVVSVAVSRSDSGSVGWFSVVMFFCVGEGEFLSRVSGVPDLVSHV